ncbi:MAG TPA: hypothetical protein VM818_14955 [Vicinamibacterales bacterium]|jgi:hypothetical protein|nr:hypothetical protein [Vicinamibacterales bacterium]
MTQFPESPNRGVMIVLAYLWPFALIPLIVEKDDPEIQWHARNGLALAIAEVLLLFVYLVIMSLVSVAALGLGFVLGFLLVFAWIGILGLHLVAILKGIGGGRLVIPGLSRTA